MITAIVILILITLPCSASIINIPSDEYPTIQAGVDASVDGDTVLLAPGTYTGEGNKNVYVTDRDIVIMSAGDPEDCVIDCEEEEGNRAFLLEYGNEKEITFIGITFANGYLWSVEYSGGAAVKFRGSLPPADYGSGIFIQCNFQNNSSSSHGGAIKMSNNDLYVYGCRFIGNHTGGSGGAVYTGTGNRPE